MVKLCASSVVSRLVTVSLGTMGSIFITKSFTLLGIAFTEGIRDDITIVGPMALFSIFIFFLFFVYNLKIQPWVSQSINRMYEIEEELIRLGFNIGLHHNIREGDRSRRLTGRNIVYFMTIMMLGVWVVRLLFLYG